MNTTLQSSRSISLGWLALGQVAFAAAFSPAGVRSGQWSLPGIPAVDLVSLASGALLVHPFMLYPLWAAFGPGRRYAAMLILCLAVFSAAAVRGRTRGDHEPLVPQAAITVVLFVLTTLAVWPIRRLGKWQLCNSGTCSTGARGRPAPVQFRLRHLFEGMTLAAAILAFCRLYSPDGIPAELTTGWRQEFTRFFQAIPHLILGLLPAALMAGFILLFPKDGRIWRLCAIATLLF